MDLAMDGLSLDECPDAETMDGREQCRPRATKNAKGVFLKELGTKDLKPSLLSRPPVPDYQYILINTAVTMSPPVIISATMSLIAICNSHIRVRPYPPR
jgi:hypothetical protein